VIPARLQRINEPSGKEIGHDLWSHLQIEDGLVHSWGEVHKGFITDEESVTGGVL
jgi:hypothetical protein